MDKLYRRNQILDLLRTGEVADQAELRLQLARRGIHVTQATISRDMRELGAIKTRDGYRLPSAAEAEGEPQPTLGLILKEFLRDVRQASNLAVIRTHPGTAHTVAIALDEAAWPEVVGTVAGDDTIFIAAGGPREAARIRQKILDAVES